MLGYRMFARIEGEADQLIDRSREQFYAWLRRKSLDADALEPGERIRVGDFAVATLLERSETDGSLSLRARLVEDAPTGRWTTDVTAHLPGRSDRVPWLLIDVDGPTAESVGDTLQTRLRWVATPKIATWLLDVVTAHDGRALLRPKVTVIGVDAVEDVLEVACDPDRRGLAFVAGSTAADDLDGWTNRVGILVGQTVGLATAYVLDPVATLRFNEGIGYSHRVSPGSIRTFKPGADPAVDVDAQRHRVLSSQRIDRDNVNALAKMLGWKAREAAIEPALPKDVARVFRSFETDLDDLAATGAFPIIVPQIAAEELDVTAIPAQRAIPESESIQDVRADIREMRAQIDELRDLADYYRQCYDDAQLDEAAADLERRAAVETVLRLRKVLALDGRAADAWAAESEPVDDPADYDNLIPRIDELEFVCFTGDRDPIEDLAEHNPLATWAGKAWDAAQVLDDYARAVLEGKHSGGMDAYLRNTPSGFRGYSRKNHAATESQDVHNNPKFRQQRVFRVPIELDAYGEVPMFAHFKLVTSKMISPRLHYLDATASTGMVYIGYIGRHLDTKQTN